MQINTEQLERDQMSGVQKLKIKLFMDGAQKEAMTQAYQKGVIQGFTTNPSLMRKAGVTDYEEFAKKMLVAIPDRSISFEVFSDDFGDMEKEARKIAPWGGNVYVKIPITNTKGESSIPLVRKLSGEKFTLNVTAILTLDQVRAVKDALNPNAKSIVSVFAGRIADTGQDPIPIMSESAQILKSNPNAELLWASCRELLNIFQADRCGCHIITVSPDILKKLPMINQDLKELSLDTVKQFYRDAQSAGFQLL